MLRKPLFWLCCLGGLGLAAAVAFVVLLLSVPPERKFYPDVVQVPFESEGWAAQVDGLHANRPAMLKDALRLAKQCRRRAEIIGLLGTPDKDLPGTALAKHVPGRTFLFYMMLGTAYSIDIPYLVVECDADTGAVLDVSVVGM